MDSRWGAPGDQDGRACAVRRPGDPNGHEYVAIAAQGEGIGFAEGGNCFTESTDPVGLAQIAGTLSHHADLLHLRLLGLSGRVLPEPAVRLRRSHGPGVQRDAGPGPVPAGHPGVADLVRRPPSRQVRHSSLAQGRGRARDTCTGPDGIQSPLPAVLHALDCAGTGFLPDGTLDQLPLPAQRAPAGGAGRAGLVRGPVLARPDRAVIRRSDHLAGSPHRGLRGQDLRLAPVRPSGHDPGPHGRPRRGAPALARPAGANHG